MSGTSGTISIPSIYLKARGTNSIPTKKARLPSNLNTLFKICNRLFQKYGEVKTIYNSDGSVVKDISEVNPDSTLYVSNREANENETIASRQGLFALGRPPESSPTDGKDNKNLQLQNNDSFNALFGRKDGSGRKNSKQSAFHTRDQQLLDESARRNQEKQNQINQSLERQKRKQEEKKRQQEAEKRKQQDEIRRKQEEEERRRREEEERRRREEEEARRRKIEEEEEERRHEQKNQDIDYDYDEEDAKQTQGDEQSKRSIQDLSMSEASRKSSSRQANSSRNSPRNRESVNSDLSSSFDSSFDPQMFMELFSKILDNNDLNDDVADELSNSEQWMKRFLGLAPQFENEQMANWYGGLYDAFSQIGLPVSFLDKPHKKSSKSNKGENENDIKNDGEIDTSNQNRNQNGFNDDIELFGKDEILKYVRDTIIRHRFISSQNYIDYNFNIAIIGPRSSGKSNILTCFASEIMKELCVTDNWRHFFLFPINFKVFAPFYEDLSALYGTMVDMVVSCLSWQAPFYSQYGSAIKKLFMSSINVQLVGASSTTSTTKPARKSQTSSTTTSPTPTKSMFSKARAPPIVPKNSLFYRDVPHFALALQKVAQEIFNVWNEPGSLAEFMSLIYSLPSLISKAAGFSKVIYFIDNIEFADVEIIPSKPFNANSENAVIYNIEILQYVLSGQHFVVTGEEQKRIFESLSPVEEKYLDLESRVDFVSTIGIIPIDENDNRLIRTEIQNEPLPFSFTIDACCGVPAFIQMWVELNDEFDSYEEHGEEDNDEEKEEDHMLLITHAQQVIDVLFTFDDKSPLFVTNVKRSAKEAEKSQS